MRVFALAGMLALLGCTITGPDETEPSLTTEQNPTISRPADLTGSGSLETTILRPNSYTDSQSMFPMDYNDPGCCDPPDSWQVLDDLLPISSYTDFMRGADSGAWFQIGFNDRPGSGVVYEELEFVLGGFEISGTGGAKVGSFGLKMTWYVNGTASGSFEQTFDTSLDPNYASWTETVSGLSLNQPAVDSLELRVEITTNGTLADIHQVEVRARYPEPTPPPCGKCPPPSG